MKWIKSRNVVSEIQQREIKEIDMPLYRVNGVVTRGTFYVDIEAESQEKAIEKVWFLAMDKLNYVIDGREFPQPQQAKLLKE